MQLPTGPDPRSRVEEFRRRHRVAFLTLLFTDIVGSTQIKQRLGDTRAVMLIQRHHAALRELLAAFPEGEEIETAGDSFFLVFTKPSDAVRFALRFQQRARAVAAETGEPVLDRIGIHVGEVFVQEHRTEQKAKDLYGLQVDTCARVMGLGQGDQILMTRSVFDGARQILKNEELAGFAPLGWLNHGPYRMKGVEEPIEVCEAGETGLAVLRPPADSDKAHRHVSADSEPVLGWRPAVAQDVPGTSWTLEEKLGEGGFGEVWLARHAVLPQRRVIKFCFRADHVRSLRREVALFRILSERVGQHPNVATLHDVFFEEPPFYLVTDYAPGRDLATWCARHGGIGRVPVEVRLEIVAQIADALQAAQDSGIVHRDVKPSNILLGSPDLPTGGAPVHALLSDFGIGQVTNPELLGGATRAGFSMTIEAGGAISGTLAYMAPEIAAGQAATPRSDLYSLGVVLFQMLVGDFNRPMTTDWKVAIKDPLLSADLEHCFAGDPQERFSGAGELARRLRTLPERRARLDAEALVQRGRERAAQRRGMLRVAAIAGVLVLGFAGLAAWAWQQTQLARTESVARLREWQRAEQESTNRLAQWKRAEHSLVLLDCDEAERELAGHRVAQAAARLATAARNHPDEILPLARLANLAVTRLSVLAARHPSVELPPEAGVVLWASFAPDGQRLVTQSRDKLVRVWDVASAKRVGEPFPLVRKPVPAGDGTVLPTLPEILGRTGMRPDGRQLMTVAGHFVSLWDVEGGAPSFAALAHPDNVASARFSPDGRRLATICADKTVRVWDTATGKALGEPLVHERPVATAHFSPDGTRLATRSMPPPSAPANPRPALVTVSPMEYGWRLWDVATGKPIAPPFLREGVVMAEFFGPDAFKVVVSPNGKTAMVWDVTAGRLLGQPIQIDGGIRAAGFSPDGKRVVIISGKLTQVWDTTTGLPIGEPLAPDGVVADAVFSPDGLRMLTVSGDDTARVWDAASGRPLGGPIRHRGHVWVAAFAPDGGRVVTASEDKSTRISDVVAGTVPVGEPVRLFAGEAPERKAPSPEDYLRVVDLSADGRLAVTVPPRGNAAIVWDSRTGLPVGEPLRHDGAVVSAAFARGGTRLLTLSDAGTARVWNTGDGATRPEPRVLPEPAVAAGISPDGRKIATASRGTDARVWDAETGQPIGAPLPHGSHVIAVEFSPDGKRVVTASGPLAQVWDAETGKPAGEPLRHDGDLLTVRFSLDGRRVVTASAKADGKAWNTAYQAWDAASSRPAGKALEQSATAPSPHFGRDGTQLVAVFADGTARFWDVGTGEANGEPLREESPIRLARFTPDGGRVVTLTDDRTARLWDVVTRKSVGESFRIPASAVRIVFDGEGQRMLVGSTDGGGRVWDTPWPGTGAGGTNAAGAGARAAWTGILADYAEACVGLRYPGDGRFEKATNSPAAVLASGRSAYAGSTHPLANLLAWLAADPADRAISPSCAITPDEWIGRRAREGSAAGLHDAVLHRPTNAVWVAEYALRLALESDAANPRRAGEADYLSRHAVRLAPRDAAVQRLRDQVTETLAAARKP